MKKITKILANKECTKSELFEKASEALYALEPSASAAYNLAKLNLKKEKPDLDLAAKYYEEAYSQEKDTALLSKYYYEAALVESARGVKQKSRTLARKAISVKPDYGDAYVLIAKLYASTTSCGKNSFLSSFVFCAAIDKLVKAIKVDSSVSAEANKLIASYSKYLPDSGEAMMQGKEYSKAGVPITVGCWINESTTLRFR